MPSTVTWPSCIASRSAAWVFGVARLISSASSTWAKSGPGRNSKSLVRRFSTLVPVMSVGIRSGVNCTRWNDRSSMPASMRTKVVLPTPGTSSIRTCDPVRMPISTSFSGSRMPNRRASTLVESSSWKVRAADAWAIAPA